MTIKSIDEYREAVDGAPIDLFEAAERAFHIKDDAALQGAAADLLDAQRRFEEELEDREIELG